MQQSEMSHAGAAVIAGRPWRVALAHLCLATATGGCANAPQATAVRPASLSASVAMAAGPGNWPDIHSQAEPLEP